MLRYLKKKSQHFLSDRILGTKDPTSKLPGYYYRDDALKLWKKIEKFVENVIEFYYKSDEVLNKASTMIHRSSI